MEKDEIVEEGTYFLRKRARTIGQNTESSPYVYKRPYKRKSPLADMPTEVLQKIFSLLSNEELATNVRLVNRRFRVIAQDALNSNFKQLLARLQKMQKMIVYSIHHTRDEMEIRCMCKMLRSLELLIFNHSIIKSTIWRYIYFTKPISNMCMYAGSILDLYDVVLSQFVTDPHIIYSPAILRDYALSDAVKAICASTKMFALYFDRVTEMPVNTDSFCSGSKILDILDSAADVKRSELKKQLIGNTLILKLKYFFTNAWFVAFDIPEEKPKQWNEEQRVMYMRLRRIVISHSEMTMEYSQYKREMMLRSNPTTRIRKPINSVYTGYGEVGGTFFYYGVMNEGAYFNKFDVEESDQMDFGLFQDQTTDSKNIPYLGLEIVVELRCPLQLAPCKIIEQYENNRERHLTSGKRLRGLFDLLIYFNCPGAKYPRLPSKYRYYLRYRK